MEYVKTCQIFNPEFPHHRGACCEETAQTDHIASRDTVEALQGFVNLYAVTRDPVILLRAQAAADWLTGWFLKTGYPNGYIWHKDKNDKGSVCDDFSRLMLGAAGLPLCQLNALTGEKKYAAFVPDYMDWIVDHALEKDGALKIHDGTDVSHHAVRSGPLAGCFTNDDGVGIALIAAFRATGSEKYREAALRNGEWWLTLDRFPETHASVPAALNYFLDLYRLSGDKRFLEKSGPYIDAVLSSQCLDPGNRAHGGFRGHDLAGQREKKIHTASSLEYVSHRTTMYAMMALAKAAAQSEKEWNMAYSAFGW
jgi:rhamnogalacturonyl hydrolase YesR